MKLQLGGGDESSAAEQVVSRIQDLCPSTRAQAAFVLHRPV